jgi:hypothetical protein
LIDKYRFTVSRVEVAGRRRDPNADKQRAYEETRAALNDILGSGVKRRAQPSPELGRALQVLKTIMPSVKAKPEPKPKKTYPRNVN